MDEITRTNGRDEMFYTGESPWHNKGVRLDGPATSEEALIAAGMDWSVAKVPLEYEHEGTRIRSNRYAVARLDTGAELGVVSATYQPLQNRDAFRFFDAVVAAGQAIYHTAGSVRGGRRVWILAKLPGDLSLDSDVIERYILLANSHDGSIAVSMKPTAIRVVCSNTLSASLNQRTRLQWSATHTGDVMARVTEAREALDLTDAHFGLMMRSIEEMARTRMSDTDRFFRKLFRAEEEDDLARSRRVSQIMNLYKTGRGNEGRTRWDMLNAITEWVDHRRGQKTHRLESAWFGSGNLIKSRAYEILAEA